mgnify:FL=1
MPTTIVKGAGGQEGTTGDLALPDAPSNPRAGADAPEVPLLLALV